MKYDYFLTTEQINPGKIAIAYSWFNWFRCLGHICWIDKVRADDNGFRYRVWRYGIGHKSGDNQDECTGIIVAASHPEIVERFKGNTLAGPRKRAA